MHRTDDIEHTIRYLDLIKQVIREREAAGGSLTDEREAAHVDELSRLWWQMTESQQRNVEAELAARNVPVVGGWWH